MRRHSKAKTPIARWRVAIRRYLKRPTESDGVYVELVAGLFAAVLPTAIMSIAFLAIGLFGAISFQDPVLAVIVTVGTAFSALKLWVDFEFRSRHHGKEMTRAAMRRLELQFQWSSVGFAATVGALCTHSFLSDSLDLQLLATGLLFSYCAGVVARLAVRPRICVLSLLLAALPVIAAAASRGTPAHGMVAAMFALFLVGGLETARATYLGASRLIALTLDMAAIARYDDLTGVSNRLGLRDAFRRLRLSDETPMVAVHCLDLDQFKPVNDRYGHAFGDELLRNVGARLRAAVRPSDIVARTGGDEFIVVQGPIRHAEEAQIFAHRLARAITESYAIEGRDIRVGVSIGYATSPPGPPDLDQLTALADAALYRIKRNGGGVLAGSVALAAS